MLECLKAVANPAVNPAKTPNAPVVTVRVVSHPNPPKRPNNVVLHDTVGLHVRVANKKLMLHMIFFHQKKIDSSNNFSGRKIGCSRTIFPMKKLILQIIFPPRKIGCSRTIFLSIQEKSILQIIFPVYTGKIEIFLLIPSKW
jgi:hypothetical protein